MELRITNPQENWLTEQILWNNEELKAAIAEKVKDYKTIAYTEDSLKRKLEAERMEAERKAREAEEAAKQQTAAEQKEEPAAEKEAASGSVPEAPAEETASIPEEEEPVFQLDFRVWGTSEQLMALREYMLKNQIRFGKVE